MALSKSELFEKRLRQVLLLIACFTFTLITYVSISSFAAAAKAGRSDGFLILILFSYFFPIVLLWSSFRILCMTFLVPVSLIVITLGSVATRNMNILLMIPLEVFFCGLLFYHDQKNNATLIHADVELEKMTSKKNDLEIAYQERGMSISVSFEKYTSYYNLRSLANDFSTTFSLSNLCQLVVTKIVHLIQKGDLCMLLMSEAETGSLSLMASRSSSGAQTAKTKVGDLFDFWVLRNRQSLIVQDTQKDFRFDLKKELDLSSVRSLIGSPLLHEGKPIGVIRIQSLRPSIFSTDDLRVLDAISTLASAAISNAILFQKTEELAIRDSLTGLYVQRHFLERLREEHRRSLLTNGPFALLMSDLDHFKACNDRYGHGVGDLILREVAQILSEVAKDGIVARYGGEEFSILLPNSDVVAGAKVAQTICELLVAKQLVIRREHIPITISIGVSAFPSDTLDAEELIRIADKRLYEAKHSGRNQICFSE